MEASRLHFILFTAVFLLMACSFTPMIWLSPEKQATMTATAMTATAAAWTATPTDTATATITYSPTPTPTAAPTHTPTATPAETSTRTPTKTPTFTPTLTPTPSRYYASDHSFSFLPPENWKMTNSDNYAIDFAAPSTGDAVGLSIMQKQKESGKENLSILVGITHAFFATADITEVSEKYFTRTDDDIPYARWEFVINSNDGKSHNVIYMFDADDWQLVVFYTRPSNQGEENDILVDEAMKTLCYGNEQTLATTPTSIAKSETSEIAMVLIPAGTFEMGSDTDKALAECEKLRTQSGDCQAVWFSAESPIHKVTLNTFYMDVYEVTNAFYSECVRAGKCNAPTNSCPNNCTNYYGNPQYANYPVTWVSWEDANDYCTWRDARLPSEAEWEYAARGGLSGKNYPWGDTFDGKSLNFCDTNCAEDWKNTDYDDGFADISPVGNYAPNDYGLFDMVGNAYEWVADWFDVYPGGDSRVRDDYGQMYRVLRGGSFFDSGYYQRVSNRFRWAPSEKYSNFGFRCAQTP